MTVVIAIIAVLIGLLFPAIDGAQRQARNVQAKNDLRQIVIAVNGFYTDYGAYPSNYTPEITFDGFNGNTNDHLFNALRGKDSTVNPKNIVFVSPAMAKSPNSPTSGIGVDGQWYDPWGKPYIIRLDTNYDGLVVNPYSNNAGVAPSLNAGVIAWSFGSDKQSDSVPGPAPDKNTGIDADDVISWQ